MFMLNSNEPIKVAHLQNLPNVEWHNVKQRTDDRNGKQFFQWKEEKF